MHRLIHLHLCCTMALWRTHAVLALLALSTFLAVGCEPTDALRFRDQEPWYRFDGQLFVLEAKGARLVGGAAEVREFFECPGADARLSNTDVPVLRFDATSLTPGFDIIANKASSVEGLFRCDTTENVGIEVTGLPFGMVDIYQRCATTAGGDHYISQCDLVVPSCAGLPEDTTACSLVVEGSYRLVAYSEYQDDPGCWSAAQHDSYSTELSALQPCAACNAFEPVEITTAFRAAAPDAEGCCASEPETPPHLAFCVRPCSCRTTHYRLLPKTPSAAPVTLRMAVISDVEEHRSTFKKFVASALAQDVDFVVHIGDMTKGGGQGAIRSMASYVRGLLTVADGAAQEGGSCEEVSSDEDPTRVCCAAEGRQYAQFCMAPLQAPPLLNGLGQNETSEESFFTYFEQYGPSNSVAQLGRVRIVMIDSAEGTVSRGQFAWLERVLQTPQPRKLSCALAGAPPAGAGDWPVLGACAPDGTCDQCGVPFALCIPPAAGQGSAQYGPQNCVCVEDQSTPCPGNFSCLPDPAGGMSCGCTRDGDCGPGWTCAADGTCEPPLTLFFSHAPPFDIFGARNAAFRSRREAARLVALLAEHGVDFIFAGSINTFAKVAIAKIPTFITGGGGADMEAFDGTGHHWLLVTIDDPFGTPTAGDVHVEVMPLN